jgi:hypothetical protein
MEKNPSVRKKMIKDKNPFRFDESFSDYMETMLIAIVGCLFLSFVWSFFAVFFSGLVVIFLISMEVISVGFGRAIILWFSIFGIVVGIIHMLFIMFD